MRIQSIIVAGAALATMALVPPTSAIAGGGVQLNFGGPLGTFTARPHGGGGHYDHAPARRGHKLDNARKNAMAERKAAARRAKIAEARKLEAKRRQAAAEQKLAAKREAAEMAKKKAIAAKRTEDRREIAKIEATVADKVEKVEQAERIVRADKSVKIDAVATPEAAPVRASPEGAIAAAVPVAAIATDKADGEILLQPIDVETSEEANSEVAANQSGEGPSAAEELVAPQNCKRFVPSAGLTITVPCGE